MTATEAVPDAVAARWWSGPGAAGPGAEPAVRFQRLAGGLINQTFAVHRGDQPAAVLQQLHPVFGPEVNLDIEAVTTHLAARGMVTPRLLRTLDGAAWVLDDGKVWRALTWVDGRSVDRVPDARWAEAGGELVGRYHRAVADLAHDYRFSRGNVHDTPRHLARLRACLEEAAGAPAGSQELPQDAPERQATDLGHAILSEAAGLPEIPVTALRHCHGDLKISNLVFEVGEPVAGRCLVDLDTVSRGTIAFELGDAMRSWCNPGGEELAAAGFDLALFAAAMRGFRAVADELLSDDERGSIVTGLATVCVELAARFCIDVFEDRYFGWNPARYPSRRQHNLVRAHSQLSLARSVRHQLDDALAIVRSGRGC